MKNDIATTLTKTVEDSVRTLREQITNVRYGPYVSGQTTEILAFEWHGRTWFAALRGRNAQCVLGSDQEANTALVVRAILDGDNWPA
jgi:hypothetical protein